MPVSFKTVLKKFDSQGEKTGWTYIHIPAETAAKIKSGTKRSFRVKGTIDKHKIAGIAMIPFGGGDFIISVNADMRKAIRKRKGDIVSVNLAKDKSEYVLDAEFIECLQDDPAAIAYFNTLLPSHQRYFSKWIESAKTETTRVKRISMAVIALGKKMGYPEMIRESQTNKL